MPKRHSNQIGNRESLFLRMEELVLANSGEDEFEEVFKLLVAKLWDEHSGKSEFYPHDNDQATYQAIKKLLVQANKNWTGILEEIEPRLTPEHLTICVDALSQHKILDESFEVVDSFFEFIVSKSAKGAKGQYFTPRHVVELCVRMLNPKIEETILDPACGSGGFLFHTLKFIKEKNSFKDKVDLQDFCSKNIWGFDIDSKAVRVAKVLMVLAGDGSTNIIRTNSLIKPTMLSLLDNLEGPSFTIEDVCRSRMRNHKGFDVILTNPPFAGEVKENYFLSEYSLGKGKKRIERDILFVERCIELLKPGGRLAIVLPHNKFGGKSFDYLRKWIINKARILAVVALGRNTFLPHTHQKASILFLKKIQPPSELKSDYNIFFAVSEKDGKNSKGQAITRKSAPKEKSIWNDIDHDFEEVLDEFSKFLTQEKIDL